MARERFFGGILQGINAGMRAYGYAEERARGALNVEAQRMQNRLLGYAVRDYLTPEQRTELPYEVGRKYSEMARKERVAAGPVGLEEEGDTGYYGGFDPYTGETRFLTDPYARFKGLQRFGFGGGGAGGYRHGMTLQQALKVKTDYEGKGVYLSLKALTGRNAGLYTLVERGDITRRGDAREDLMRHAVDLGIEPLLGSKIPWEVFNEAMELYGEGDEDMAKGLLTHAAMKQDESLAWIDQIEHPGMRSQLNELLFGMGMQNLSQDEMRQQMEQYRLQAIEEGLLPRPRNLWDEMRTLWETGRTWMKSEEMLKQQQGKQK
jgi:hypothetical protein